MTSRKTGLYVHLPWCVKKCPYCDFNSHESKDPDFARYMSVLKRNLLFYVQTYQISEFNSVFLGGGTPSLFPPSLIAKLIQTLQAHSLIHDTTEITMEANPGTLEEKNLEGFCNAGINRLSIGVQSFDNDCLKRIGRIHDSQQAKRIIKLAQQLPFNSINIDLMYGLPSQHLSEALNDLEQALSFQVDHISWYELTMEPNTLFYKTRPRLPEDDVMYDMEQEGHALLKMAGFEHYEISAFAKPGFMCEHNLTYWHYHDYLGVGAGAHSKISQEKIIRAMEIKHPNLFMSSTQPKYQTTYTVDSDNECFEFALNRFRLHKPISEDELKNLSKFAREKFIKISQELTATGLLTIEKKSTK